MPREFGIGIPEPMLAPSVDGGGGFREQRRAERKPDLTTQIDNYFGSLRQNLQFDVDAIQTAYEDQGLLHPTVEVPDRAEQIVRIAVNRNNAMADVLSSAPYRATQERERQLRGEAAVGKIVCIDGRIATAHTSGTIEGVQESMGGCVDTSISKLTGQVELKSQTLDRAIEERPVQEASEVLEIDYAHGQVSYQENGDITAESDCGAMKKFEAEAEARGNPFETTDLIAENFRLMEPAVEAITRKYNLSASDAGKKPLDKVVIRAVFDTRSQGTLLGYGDQNVPFFTSAVLEALEPQLFLDLRDDPRLREPGYFRQSFTQIDRYLDKEERTADLIEYFMGNRDYRRSLREATDRLDELQGLTPNQQQALAFSLAKTMAFQWLTGLYKRELAPSHPFSRHNEQFQAITVDDGYGATVGQHDPEVQVFAANTATIPEAVDHVKTKNLLMDHYAEGKPYVLFISSGIAESAANNPDVRKQARATVGRTFKGITQNDDIAEAVRSGTLIPVPAIVTSRSNRVIEIPNLLR